MSSDYIRRADAVDALTKTMPTPATPDGTGEFDHEIHIADEAFADAIRIIEFLKPADVVQVVHAHWIQTSAEDENGNAYYYCSNCGRGESHNPIVEVPYCWKCGAKMDKHGEG